MLIKLKVELEHLKFTFKKMELYLLHLKDELINRIKNIGVPLPKIHYNNDNFPYQIAIRKSSARALERKKLYGILKETEKKY